MNNIIEKYCFIKIQYLVENMMYKKSLNYIKKKFLYYCDLYEISK